jgi:glycosyltransferase involved in cell wall biosynthesis
MRSVLHNLNKPPVFVYVINVDWYFELHWLQRALATLNSGAEVHLVMGMTDPRLIDSFSQYGFTCHQWNIDRKSLNPFFNLQGLIELYRLLKSISPDVIHAITIKPNIYVGLIFYLLKVPYLLSITGTGIIFSGKSLSTKLIKPIIRLLYKASKRKDVNRRIVFENSEDKAYFINTGLCDSHEAVTILGAGVNPDIYEPIAERETDTPVILFAARLLWDKGLGDLVEAAKHLRSQGLNFVIQVAGIIDNSTVNAIDEQTLKAWSREGAIQWLGTEKNMPNLLAQANIVVLPTFYGEGVPRILIEAASCERAIVATDMPGCREIVKHGINGLLVPARDIEALTEALAQLIQNPAIRKGMGKQGRKIVERDFSEQQVISETLSLYKELLS